MAQEDPPYSLDFFQTITDVHFASGLAVEFFAGKSHLTFSQSLGMTTASLSTWFRISEDAATALQARDASANSEHIPVLDHVAPFIMFGGQQRSLVYDVESQVVYCEYPPLYTIENGNAPFRGQTWTGDPHPFPAQQSCIGVQCLPGQDPVLYVHLQPSASPSVQGTRWDDGPDYTCLHPGVHDPVPVFTESSYVDEVIAYGAVGNSQTWRGTPFGGRPTITLEHWHHLLLTWTLGGESSFSDASTDPDAGSFPSNNITSTSKMYCVLDGINKNGLALPATWVGSLDISGGPDLNLIACGAVFDVASGLWVPNLSLDPYEPPTYQPTASMSYGAIPSKPLWLPGSFSANTQARGTINPVQHVEMGELQLFPGHLLLPDQLGLFLKNDGTPQDMKVAAKALGTPPIVLHGSENWKKGKNTGSIKAGFKPTGKIPRYKPDPSLNGPQSP